MLVHCLSHAERAPQSERAQERAQGGRTASGRNRTERTRRFLFSVTPECGLLSKFQTKDFFGKKTLSSFGGLHAFHSPGSTFVLLLTRRFAVRREHQGCAAKAVVDRHLLGLDRARLLKQRRQLIGARATARAHEEGDSTVSGVLLDGRRLRGDTELGVDAVGPEDHRVARVRLEAHGQARLPVERNDGRRRRVQLVELNVRL